MTQSVAALSRQQVGRQACQHATADVADVQPSGFHDHKTCNNQKWKQKLRQHQKGREKRAPMGYAHHRTSSEMVRPLYRLPICTRPSLRVEVVPFQV